MPAAFSAGAFDLLEAASFYRAESATLCSLIPDRGRPGACAIAGPTANRHSAARPISRRVLHTFPYALIYRVEPNGLYVVAVAHQRHRPGY